MSETTATYGHKAAAEADLLKAEALAVRHVCNLSMDEREDAAAKLDAAAIKLPGLAAAVAKAMKKTPGLLLVDVAAMMDRPALREEAEALRAAGAADLLDPAKAQDPEACAAAFSKALENTAKAANRRQAEEAAKLLARVDAAPTAEAGRGLLDDAAERLERLQRQTETPLAEAWEAHLAAKAAPVAGPHEVLRLDKRRGPWAAWMYDNLGPRGGLEAGETFILGGGPEAGKTSMAALLAVDAMAAGCPVLFWQLELSREETLEHLLAQVPEPPGWWKAEFWHRAKRTLPDAWADAFRQLEPPEAGRVLRDTELTGDEERIVSALTSAACRACSRSSFARFSLIAFLPALAQPENATMVLVSISRVTNPFMKIEPEPGS